MPNAEHIAVLIVEDNPSDIDLIELYLNSSEPVRYDIIHCTTVSDALNTIKNQFIDVILLDLSLPDSIGLSSFHEVHEYASDIPIVILTGNEDETMAAAAVREGAQDYLPKQRLDSFVLTQAIRFAIQRKQAEQKYIEIASERERVHVISDFIRDVSHEFRTPLSVISTSVQLLEMIVDENDRTKQYGSIKKQIDVILTLVEALVTMSELDTNASFKHEPCNVNHMLDMCLASIQHIANQNQIMLMFEANDSPMTIAADPQKFHTAVRCLLDNAVRYTESGGSVHVDAFQDNDDVVIQITDTGIGINPDVLPHIFKRFYREDQSHTTAGFGLGLSIAHSIIERHYGQLNITSTAGHGTIATIRLPAI